MYFPKSFRTFFPKNYFLFVLLSFPLILFFLSFLVFFYTVRPLWLKILQKIFFFLFINSTTALPVSLPPMGGIYRILIVIKYF